MADAVTVTISGFRELDEALRRLPVEVQTKLMEPALGEAGEVIRRGIVRRIRRRTGGTAGSVVVVARAQGPTGLVTIGGSTGKGTSGFKLTFLEFGTKASTIQAQSKKKPRKTSRKFRATKFALAARGFGPVAKVDHPATAAQSPMRKALKEDGDAAVKRLGQELYDGIAAYAERVPKGQA
jgi:hypothetical protein